MRICMPCPYPPFEIVALNQIFIGISIDLSFIQSNFLHLYNKYLVKCGFFIFTYPRHTSNGTMFEPL